MAVGCLGPKKQYSVSGLSATSNFFHQALLSSRRPRHLHSYQSRMCASRPGLRKTACGTTKLLPHRPLPGPRWRGSKGERAPHAAMTRQAPYAAIKAPSMGAAIAIVRVHRFATSPRHGCRILTHTCCSCCPGPILKQILYAV